jgi:hypothetical protein
MKERENIFSFILLQATLRSEPADIQFSEMKTDERSSVAEATVSTVFILCACVCVYNLKNIS